MEILKNEYECIPANKAKRSVSLTQCALQIDEGESINMHNINHRNVYVNQSVGQLYVHVYAPHIATNNSWSSLSRMNLEIGSMQMLSRFNPRNPGIATAL